jgi:hypothetical protein
MDIFDETIIDFWRALKNNNVKFIMVGGYATNVQGYQRYTGDMDIWINDNDINRDNLINAFIEADMGNFPMLKTIQFIPGWTDFSLNNGLRLDVMTSLKGLEEFTFDECFSLATIATIEHIDVPFLHINHLIQNKKAVNRPKDQVDVMELEKIKKLREEAND